MNGFSERTYPVGAELVSDGVDFRVWAPRRRRVEVVLFDAAGSELPERVELLPETEASGAYFRGVVPGLQAGTRYAYRVDAERWYPDPASHFQPQGVHGPSQVIDSRSFAWTDQDWRGIPLEGQVFYELHLGTFTAEGTWQAAIAKLDYLRELGITALEVMPVAEFDGDFGWGYDGVYWYAPTRLYGSPDDFRAFVDAAHGRGLAVILDVVYNHFGPTGNYTAAFSDTYISHESTEWGDAINFDGSGSEAVREFVAANTAYWVREFHLDGFRFDATHSIHDESEPHILAEASRAARLAAGERTIVLIAENEHQDVRHLKPRDEGGFDFDAVWNDDFHHACRVAATGHREFYYHDFTGRPQELVSAVRHGYLFQGQWNERQGRYRGSPALHSSPQSFVTFLQNHDQVANSAHGERLHQLTSPGRYRALTAFMLLCPSTPMLFMGQEFLASTPFLYFADHETDLAPAVRDGRWQYLRSFGRIAGRNDRHPLDDPGQRETFERSKLDWDEAARHAPALQLHRDLLRLRQQDPTFAGQRETRLEGAVLGPESLALRWVSSDPNAGDQDRLLLLNLGADYDVRPLPEPLLAAPPNGDWHPLWSSEDPQYGGAGTPRLDGKQWNLPGHAAVVLTARPT